VTETTRVGATNKVLLDSQQSVRCKIDFKEAMTQERPLEAIDSNAAITFTIRVAMDIFNLAQGRQKGAIPATNLERLAQGDKSARFQTRG
jgi:hypothetical protein